MNFPLYPPRSLHLLKNWFPSIFTPAISTKMSHKFHRPSSSVPISPREHFAASFDATQNIYSMLAIVEARKSSRVVKREAERNLLVMLHARDSRKSRVIINVLVGFRRFSADTWADWRIERPSNLKGGQGGWEIFNELNSRQNAERDDWWKYKIYFESFNAHAKCDVIGQCAESLTQICTSHENFHQFFF